MVAMMLVGVGRPVQGRGVSSSVGSIAVAAFVCAMVLVSHSSSVHAQRRRTPRTPTPVVVETTPTEAPAPAPPLAARELHQRGQASYSAGRYEEALEFWQAAYNLEPRAGIQYNFSQAYGRLNRLPEERAALVRFIEMLELESPERMQDAQVANARLRIIAIDDRLRNTGIALRGAPRRARLILDGEPVTSAEGVIATTAGSHELRVEVDGYVPFITTVTVGHGVRAEVDVELELQSTRTSVETRQVSRRHHRRAALGVGISGLAVMAGGSVFGIMAVGEARGSFVDSDEAESAKALGRVADVGLFAGGGLAATGFILWLVHRRDGDEPDAAPTITPVVGLGTAGVRGRF
jgi:hypothetical protein